MDEDEFGTPIFKRLSHNDSGAAAGHQGGIVIPKALDRYFPQLSRRTSAASPTVDESITAILVVAGKQVARVRTRYQYQTWGGGRTIERRITGNLGPLRNRASEDDILLIERNFEDRSLYRLTLIKKGEKQHAEILKAAKGARWGVAHLPEPSVSETETNESKQQPPVSEIEIHEAEKEQIEHESKPLNLFDNDAATVETTSKGIARSRAFQRLTTDYYGGKCAVCGLGFATEDGSSEVEAAHIVPRGKKGADDARNGLALCRSHHWAFDRGLWGVGPDEKITVPSAVLAISVNVSLKAFVGTKLSTPSDALKKPDAKALAWHLKNVVGI